MAPIPSFLQSVPLLHSLSPAELDRLATWFEARNVTSGTIILYEGRPHDSLYLLRAGRVVVTKTIRGETEAVLAHLDPPTHFGELDLIDAQCASASVTAELDCELLVLDAERLRRLFAEDGVLFGKFAWAMMQDLTAKIRRTNDKLQEVILWGLDATSSDPGEYQKSKP